MIRSTLAVLAACFLAAPAAVAQEVAAEEVTGVKRYLVTMFKLGPEGRSSLKDIIWGTWLPAMKEAGVPPPIILHPDDGEWDMIFISPLPGGYTDLHFNVSPSEAKWIAVAEKKVGKKALDEMFAKYHKAIVRKHSFIAHEH